MDYLHLQANGRFVTPEAMADLDPAVVAAELGLSVEEYLAVADEWAAGPGAPFGIVVDQENGAVRRVGG